VPALGQIISLFFGAAGSAAGGGSLQRSGSASASPALKMVASLDVSRVTADQAAKALVVLAEEFLQVARRLLLQDASTATSMKQRVLQPLQASINKLKSAASQEGGGAAGGCVLLFVRLRRASLSAAEVPAAAAACDAAHVQGMAADVGPHALLVTRRPEGGGARAAGLPGSSQE
jgi:hypothetical protein